MFHGPPGGASAGGVAGAADFGSRAGLRGSERSRRAAAGPGPVHGHGAGGVCAFGLRAASRQKHAEPDGAVGERAGPGESAPDPPWISMRSTSCSWSCTWCVANGARCRSGWCWTSMPRTWNCTAGRSTGSITGTTMNTATFRGWCSATASRCGRNCARRAAMWRRAWWRRSRRSWTGCGSDFRRCRS